MCRQYKWLTVCVAVTLLPYSFDHAPWSLCQVDFPLGKWISRMLCNPEVWGSNLSVPSATCRTWLISDRNNRSKWTQCHYLLCPAGQEVTNSFLLACTWRLVRQSHPNLNASLTWRLPISVPSGSIGCWRSYHGVTRQNEGAGCAGVTFEDFPVIHNKQLTYKPALKYLYPFFSQVCRTTNYEDVQNQCKVLAPPVGRAATEWPSHVVSSLSLILVILFCFHSHPPNGIRQPFGSELQFASSHSLPVGLHIFLPASSLG